jgi:hypothetical protein
LTSLQADDALHQQAAFSEELIYESFESIASHRLLAYRVGNDTHIRKNISG